VRVTEVKRLVVVYCAPLLTLAATKKHKKNRKKMFSFKVSESTRTSSQHRFQWVFFKKVSLLVLIAAVAIHATTVAEEGVSEGASTTDRVAPAADLDEAGQFFSPVFRPGFGGFGGFRRSG